MWPRHLLVLCLLGLRVFAGNPPLVEQALAAEAKLDSGKALELFLAANQAKPNDPFLLQKIARQYSDLVNDQTGDDARKQYAQTALDYAQRAVTLAPNDPVNVLSLAVCHGKLALYSGTEDKIKYSRLVRTEAERALAIDPNYAWAHHVLGRWHYEVATLGNTSKFFVRLFYGGLPPASVTEGIRELQRATELEPDELNHRLELGFAYAAANRLPDAKAAWVQGLAMPSRGRNDEAAKTRARAALARLN